MPCMPHFHDHFIPSPAIVLRKKYDTQAAAAAEAADVESALREAETKLRAEFKQVIRGIIQTLLPFRDAYEAVRTFMNQKAAEELQARQQLQPQSV